MSICVNSSKSDGRDDQEHGDDKQQGQNQLYICILFAHRPEAPGCRKDFTRYFQSLRQHIGGEHDSGKHDRGQKDDLAKKGELRYVLYKQAENGGNAHT